MKKSFLALFSAALLLIVSISVVADLQQCFDQLVKNLQTCDDKFPSGGPSYEACVDGAVVVFKTCIGQLPKQVDHPLYGAKIISISVLRSKGKPYIATENFTVSESGYYYFNLYNGSPNDKSTRVSSAKVKLLPDTDLFTPSDFNKNMWFKSTRIYLEAGEYTISAELASEPGSFISIIVSDKDFSVANWNWQRKEAIRSRGREFFLPFFEFGFSDFEFENGDFEFEFDDLEVKIADLEFEIDKMKVKILKMEFKIGKMKVKIGELEVKKQKMEFKIYDFNFKIWNFEFKIGDFDFKICNLEFVFGIF